MPDIQAAHEAANFPVILYEVTEDIDGYLRDHGSRLDFAAVVAEVASPNVQGILRPLLDEGAIPRETYLEAPITAEPIGADQRGMEEGQDKPAFQRYDRNVSPASNTGIPSLSLPAGMTASGLPVGVTLDGPEGDDANLLALGLGIEVRDGPLPAPTLA